MSEKPPVDDERHAAKMAKKKAAAGAKRVLISAPATDEDLTVVYGVNDDKLRKKHKAAHILCMKTTIKSVI